MFKKNDIIPLTIESITGEGSGVGHADGIAVFVPMTAAGDELKVRIVKVQKSYCYGIIEELLVPSPTVSRRTAPATSAVAGAACGTSPTKRSCGKSSAGYRMPCGASAALQ